MNLVLFIERTIETERLPESVWGHLEGIVGESVTENNTVENIEASLRTAKRPRTDHLPYFKLRISQSVA